MYLWHILISFVLIVSHSIAHMEIVKCWCCWETGLQSELIRVCRGCKDPDLQYIHQECMDRYITNLPTPRQRTQRHQDADTEDETLPLIANEQDGSDHQFFCTRCKDPYKIQSIPVSPLVILFQEKVLFPSMILITLCILVLTASCLGLIIDHFSTGTVVYFLRIPVWVLASLMLIMSHAVNGFTWIMVLRSCSSRFVRHVLPVSATDESEQQGSSSSSRLL